MRITVLTSNQPRHIALIRSLAAVADEVFAVQEVCTLFPGETADFFRKSPIMQTYFSRVRAAEQLVFGAPRFVPRNVQTLSLRMGDLSKVPLDVLAPALQSHVYVVFGASYIRGALCDFLTAGNTYNIHMGVSPYYRGSSTNFWALYDGRPDLVGATIHLLTPGLDSGPVVFHALPAAAPVDPFALGMRAVRSAHAALVEQIARSRLTAMEAVPQNRSLQLRYTRNEHFTDDVAAEYLARVPSPREVLEALQRRDLGQFVSPMVA